MHHVEILATSECGHCRHITDLVTDTCMDLGGEVEVHAVDLLRHPEAARERFGLLESPIVVVDGRVVSAGAAPSVVEMQRLLR